MDFPRLVYKNGGPHQRHGGSYDILTVEDSEEFGMAIDDGWFSSLPEAISGSHSEKTEKDIQAIDESAPPTREEIRAKAKELGIEFDGRISDAKLLAMIEEKLKEAEE